MQSQHTGTCTYLQFAVNAVGNSEFRVKGGHRNTVFSIEAIKCLNDFNSTKRT